VFEVGKRVQVFDWIFVSVEVKMLSAVQHVGARFEQSDFSGVQLESVPDGVILYL